MKTFLALIKNNIRITILHKPLSFILTTCIPVIVLIIASKVVTYSSSLVNVGVSDADHSVSSESIVGIIEELEGIKVFHMEADEIEGAFQSNKINVALKIDKGFQEELLNAKIENILVVGNESQNVYILLQSILKNHLLNLRNIGKVARGDASEFETSVNNYFETSQYVEKTPLNDKYTEYNNSNIFVGILILFVFFNASSVANVINTDRERNIYSRIFLSDAKVWMYYLANVLCNLTIAVFQIGVSILGMKYLSDSSIGLSSWNLFIILLCTATVAISFGTFYVALFEDADVSSMVSNLVNLLIIILGGCFIQVELFPDFIDNISYLSPARWAMQSILDVQQGVTMNEIRSNLLYLAGLAIVVFIAAIFITGRKERKFRVIS